MIQLKKTRKNYFLIAVNNLKGLRLPGNLGLRKQGADSCHCRELLAEFAIDKIPGKKLFPAGAISLNPEATSKISQHINAARAILLAQTDQSLLIEAPVEGVKIVDRINRHTPFLNTVLLRKSRQQIRKLDLYW